MRRYRQTIFITEQESDTAKVELEISPFEELELMGISIQHTQTELICRFSKKTYRLSLPAELQTERLTLKIGYQGKVKEYGKQHREEMKKIWQKNSVPVWERANTPLIFWGDLLVAVLY